MSIANLQNYQYNVSEMASGFQATTMLSIGFASSVTYKNGPYVLLTIDDDRELCLTPQQARALACDLLSVVEDVLPSPSPETS